MPRKKQTIISIQKSTQPSATRLKERRQQQKQQQKLSE
jgi:hypothetical protein